MRAGIAALGCAVLLAACASLPPPERSYSGRFTASAELGEWRDATSGRFTLERRGDALRLDLATPIGTTVARFELDAAGARLRAGERVLEGPDPETLAEQLLGWRLPLRGLPDWIDGRAAAGTPAAVDPPSGPARKIRQDGWSIEVLERFDDGRPRLLVLERPATPSSPSVRLRLVLDAPTAG